MGPRIIRFTADHPFLFILKNTNDYNAQPIFIGNLKK